MLIVMLVNTLKFHRIGGISIDGSRHLLKKRDTKASEKLARSLKNGRSIPGGVVPLLKRSGRSPVEPEDYYGFALMVVHGSTQHPL